MGCGCNDTNNTSGGCGCGGGITKMVVLAYEDVKWLLKQFSGKICTVWGSLSLKANKPLHLEKEVDGTVTTLVGYIDEAYKDEEGNYQSGIMSAADKKKLDGISVSGVTEGNGLSVDAEGNISMGLATETESGAMSSGDKAFLDSLSGALGSLMVVATDANNNIIGVNGVDLLFVGTETSKTFYLTAYKDGKKVDITQSSLPVSPFSKGSLDDGVLTVYARRTYALTTVNVSSPLTILTDDSSARIYLTAKSDSQCYDILKGQVYTEDGKMISTLWTFDGSKPVLQYDKTGVYWVGLPQSWSDLLGEFDETRLFVQVTMAGKSVASHVYCGRYDAGEEWGGNTAPTGCWGAVLILTSDVENESVDGSFYINVAYLPSVETYETEEGSKTTYELEVKSYMYPAQSYSYEAHTNINATELSVVLNTLVDGVLTESTDVTGECTLEYSPNVDWITKSALGGPDSLLPIDIAENTGDTTRTGTVHLKATYRDYVAEADSNEVAQGIDTRVVTYELRVSDFYYMPLLSGGEKNTIGYEGGSLAPHYTLLLDKYVDGVIDSSEEIEAEGATYSKGGGPDGFEFDSATGVITFTRNVHGYTQGVDMFVVVTAVNPKGGLLEADAQILDITQEASPTYIDIESFEYPTIPAGGGTVEPSAIGVYYYDTTSGFSSGINAACTFNYSVAEASIATMVNESTGEMEVKANDTGDTRTFAVTVEVTYVRDGITYWEKETIHVSQASV